MIKIERLAAILHECQNYLGGGGGLRGREILFFDARPLGTIAVTVRRGISKRPHEKTGDCEQSKLFATGSFHFRTGRREATTGNTSAVCRLLSPYNRLSKQSFVRFLYGAGPVARLAASPLKRG